MLRRLKTSIVGQLRNGILLYGFLCVSLSSFALIYLGYTLELKRANNTLHIQALLAASQTDRYLNDLKRKLDYLSRIKGLTEADSAIQNNLLDALIRHNRAYELVAVANKQGDIMNSISPYGLSFPYNIADIPSFSIPLRTEAEHIGSTQIVSASQSPVIDISYPIRNKKDKVDGVLIARVSLKFLTFLLDEIKIGEAGYAYIIDHQNTIVSGKHRGGDQNRMEDHSSTRSPSRTQGINGHLEPYIGKTGLKVLGAVEYANNSLWRVVVELPLSEAYAPLWRMFFIMLACLTILLGIGMGLGIMISRRMVLPLHSLVEAAKQIGKGNIAYKVEYHGDNELALLSAAFNSMSEGIKNREKELIKSNLIVESTTDAVISTDPDGKIIFWNTGAENIYGYSREEVAGVPISIIYKDEDLPYLESMITKLLQGENIPSIEVTCIHKNGRDVHILLSLMTIRDEKGTVNELVGITKDITERKCAELELKREKESAQRYLDLAGVIFLAINTEGEVTLINQKGCDVLGYDHEDIIGKNWFDNFIPKWLRENLIPVSKQLLNGDVGPVEYYENPILTKTGQERLIAWHNTILRDAGGNITGHLSSGEDITDKKLLEAKLKQAQKMESIGILAGGIAHDFNNLLFPIIGMSELLLDDLPKGSPEHENACEIYEAGKRGGELVKQILAFSRQSEHKKMPVRIQQVLKEVLMLCRATIPSDIEIEHNIRTDCGTVMADPTQIHQVGMNLITNAYHSIERSGGKITVSLEQKELQAKDMADKDLEPGAYVVLQVMDTGDGIHPAITGKIFEPYFTTKEKGKGTGLGLAVVYGIIKDHGGDIHVASRLGEGTTFSAYFPLKSRQAESEISGETESAQTGNEKILLVDDEKSISKLETQILERLGYQVVSHISSVEALARFRETPDEFDLVITDMTMPNLTGVELTRKIHSIRRDIPVIICTGFSERINEISAKSIGIKGFLMKPVVKSELAKKVRQVLDDRHQNHPPY